MRFVITGYCDSRSDLDKLEYVAESRTAWNDDSPIYRDTSLGASYVGYDTEELAWVVTKWSDAWAVTKRSDVYARFNSDDASSPPLGTAAWEVDCGGLSYTEHNLTLAPSQPPPPPTPPLPPEVKAVLSMCVVATRRYLPDADSLLQQLIGPWWSLYGFVRPQLSVASADGCDLPNFDSINQSKRICSKPDSLTEPCESGALLRILPKTSKATSQVVVGTSGSSSLVGSEGEAGRTAAYSVTVLDFVDLAKGSQSWLSRFCGNFMSVVCSNATAADDQIQCGNFARAICYPSEGLAGGYLDISVFNAASEERQETSMAALRVLDPEWSVDSPPWSSIDVIWMLLWLLPVFVPALLLPAGAVARSRAFRRAKPLLELEGALSEIEVEQKQSRFDEPAVRKAVRQARWLAFTLLLLALALVPWLTAVAALAAVLPLARKTSCEVWITSRASRRYWLSVASVSGLIYGAWLIASWSLIGTGEYEYLWRIGSLSEDRVFVSTCRQLLHSSPDDTVDSTGGYFLYEYRGKVCSVLAHMLTPRNIPFIAWTLLAQGCVSLLVAGLSLLLLLKSAGPKAIPGGRRLASSGWCGAANVDGLLTLATERTADRFAGSAKELVTGQPEAGYEAATGLYGIIGYSEHFLHDRMREGTAAIVQEAEALGDPVVLENLRYILHAPAGSSDLSFQHGWLRDRAPDDTS
ncbi:hypothetical protein EMIHUDRAFT_220219 [Emiliania huxleyi CCMP1516]|uniref:Uncharacterized protein n=2 Tax=Emiliania huxleyi TaxID=2903 RepID=A0A0D3I1J0_EMIH1|nr:hypothetical protein EMIHUDRAFT_220219 [Emiliania huxleyi CCMP1516]EOD05125.1 hypothetical protein EMIHUDRAFT_220219 [Emiliania huxleyi CCMP1516]|eukprot:XP_005757554.1 hypothetical protein EMIHUDRAFT_220219 [Emiliania huxleyi CCMP1516]